MEPTGRCQDPVPVELDQFRDAMQLYRLPKQGMGAKARRQFLRKCAKQDLSDVIDFSHPLNNSEMNQTRILELSLSWSKSLRFIDRSCRRFAVEGIDGLQILSGALSPELQARMSILALQKYSREPYNNLSNLYGPQPDLWQSAVECNDLKQFRKLRWCNLGFNYDWSARKYVPTNDIPELPTELVALADEVTKCCGYKAGFMTAEAGIVNYYPLGSAMGGHVDDAEVDEQRPIVSLSLGLSCIFLMGGKSRRDKPVALYLRSGDIVVMGGDSRHCFHGVPRIIPDSLAGDFKSALADSRHPEQDLILQYMCSTRVNINLRQVYARERRNLS